MFYAVHVGDAVHWVVFKTDSHELFNEHKKTVNAFLAGLKFSQGTTVEVKPPPVTTRSAREARPAADLQTLPVASGSRS